MNLRKLELWIVAALLLGCGIWGALLYLPRSGEPVAVLSVDGQTLRTIDLTRASDGVFSIQPETGKAVAFEIQDGALRFLSSACPDQVCIQAGWVARPGERAVCMPNRTALVCYAREEAPSP